MNLACAEQVTGALVPALEELRAAFDEDARRLADIVTIGRMHLQDASPVSLGEIFAGYEAQVARCIDRVGNVLPSLYGIALGRATAGVEIAGATGFAERAIQRVAARTGLPLVKAGPHGEGETARDAEVELSGALKAVAIALIRVADDVRCLGAEPRRGVGASFEPALLPGSSDMPGTVSPVMSQMLRQVGMRVVGNDAAVTAGGRPGARGLETTAPFIADACLDSLELLSNGATVFTDRCVRGIDANVERCAELVDRSLMLATALAAI